MISFSQGTVVLVPFPFTNLTAAKQRPALVISADWFNNLRFDRLLVAISSQVQATIEPDQLLLAPGDLASAGLPKASVVKLGKLFTVDQSLVKKRLGTLPPKTVETIVDGVKRVIQSPPLPVS